MEVVFRGNLLKTGFGIVILMTLMLTSCGGGADPTRQVDLGGGFLPIIATVVHLDGWDVDLVSTDELAEVSLHFKDGSEETFAFEGLTASVHSDNRSQMTYLKASTKGGDYWYFDRSGHWLPNGYIPKLWSSLAGADRSTSGVWVGGSELSITSSDQYSEVKVFFNDYSSQTFVTNEACGTYDLVIAADNVEAIRITLTSDGNRYYFDAAGEPLATGGGTKWYEDAD
jgi:hypothetical protein